MHITSDAGLLYYTYIYVVYMTNMYYLYTTASIISSMYLKKNETYFGITVADFYGLNST